MDHIDRERLVTYADLQHALDQRLAQVNDLLAAVERVKALHRRSASGYKCTHDQYQPWPCPTIRALERKP